MKVITNSIHAVFMRRALKLAAKADGRTSPNPMVGAVIVKNGNIIGEGYHKKAGGPHAEIEALRAAGDESRGADIYVSLEPCCHHGKTPPCAQALIDAGVKRVFYAVQDPNPRVEGGGHKMLEDAGIEVHLGPLEAEAGHLNRAFFHYITEKKPYVIAKYAMTLDGKMTTVTGESQWITGSVARLSAHHLRDLCDAVLIGVETAIKDNPLLTVRIPHHKGNHPLRVVLDSRGRLPLDSAMLAQDTPGHTLVFGTEAYHAEKKTKLAELGAEFQQVTADERGRTDLHAALSVLAKKGIVRLMVEGGAETLGAFHDAGLINEVHAYIGGKSFGGHQAPGPIGGHGIPHISNTPHYHIYESNVLDGDLLIKALKR